MKLKVYAGDVFSIYIMTYNTRFVFQGPVARSMVSVNQRLIPWQRIGFDTA